MKIKRLFNVSVLGTDIYRNLVNMYGKRQAIKEVNKLVRSGCSPYINKQKHHKTAHLALWESTPQGHTFWADVFYGRR